MFIEIKQSNSVRHNEIWLHESEKLRDKIMQ